MLTRCLLVVSLVATGACVELPDGPGECIFAYTVVAQSSSLAVGDSTNVTAKRTPGCGGKLPVTWAVDTPALARVRSTGDSTAVVTGVAPGVTPVTARNGGETGFFVLTVR
jgi:hypothetical protein